MSQATAEKQSPIGVSGLNIPTKKVHLTNLSQLPDNYCQTPGGTMFATTPGGTRIIYDRSFLLKMRNSPIASTPPANLPYIAGVTTGISPESLKENKSPIKSSSSLIKSEQSAAIQKKLEQTKPVPTNTKATPSSPSPSTTTTTTTTTTKTSKNVDSETLETSNEEPQFSMEM